MVPRPQYTSRQSTTTTTTTTSDGSCSMLSADRTTVLTHSTAPTSPDLGSPMSMKKSWLTSPGKLSVGGGVMGTLAEVSESPERTGTVLSGASRRGSAELGRGKSVKDRIGVWEGSSSNAQPGPLTDTARSPARPPMSLNGPTTPLRIPNKSSSTPSPGPAKARRVPVPLTEPTRKSSGYRLSSPPKAGPSELKRGTGSAKKMIQQWESQPGAGTSTGSPTRRTPASRALQPSKRVYSTEYLNGKPLPVPAATPLPSSSLYPAKSPSRPQPLYNPQHLMTPNRQGTSLTTPGASPSSPRKGKGKSPLKDMLDRFGGGIKDVGRKMKGKAKDRSPGFVASPVHSREDLHFWEEPKYGSNGLPGGIVFSDRMGDQEMAPQAANVIRTSTCVYLVPTPCSSVSLWGSWLTSYAALTPTHLHITYCPVFPDPKSGHSTPKRVLSGSSGSGNGGMPAVPFAAIPLPAPNQQPDVELAMKDCVEIRSLRREEIRGRGIPGAPEGIGTEVLEMVWSDGTRRYVGVEGVSGRLGWVSAIWDVILSSKPSGSAPVLPPPSPVQLAKNASLRSDSAPLSSARHSMSSAEPTPELTAFRDRLATLEAKAASPLVATLPIAPPHQAIDDIFGIQQSRSHQTTATHADGMAEATVDSSAQSHEARLRESVTQMFLTSPIPDYEAEEIDTAPAVRQQSAFDRVAQWQQPGTHHLSVFGKRGALAFPPTEVNLRKTDTLLSFDPNDLNPSRSASQVRRATTALAEPTYENHYSSSAPRLPALDELSDSITMQPPTHISHVTFPKPAVGGYQMGQPLETHPELPESSSGHSQGSITGDGQSAGSTESGTTIRTPFTEQGATYGSVAGSEGTATVVSHLEQHTAQHDQLSGQVDGVHGDVKKVVAALTTLIAAGQFTQANQPGVPDELSEKLTGLSLDIKAIENALNLSSLAQKGPPKVEEPLDERLPELHRKLDGIAKVCEDLLARGTLPNGAGAIISGAVGGVAGATAARGGETMLRDPSNRSTKSTGTAQGSANMLKGGSLGLTRDAKEEMEAGEEVAAIMADLTGGSSGSIRPGGIQVLHTSAPGSPVASIHGTSSSKAPLTADTAKQVGEVLGLVRELKDARSLQTQQTTDIARYLNELNAWLEKFVNNSTKELVTLNHRLTSITGPDAPAESEAGSAVDAPKGPQGLADLVADMHAMVSEQKQRSEAEGMVGQRLDTLLTMMGAEQERHASQQNVLEQVASILDRQRQENEVLLRALATDLTSEIRGERLRFVEAMQQATTMNINIHVEEFKKALGAEVHKSMAELGRMREEKKALEQNISDLFALKAKHGMASRSNTKKTGPPAAPVQGIPHSPRGLPQPTAPRGLPVAPGRH